MAAESKTIGIEALVKKGCFDSINYFKKMLYEHSIDHISSEEELERIISECRRNYLDAVKENIKADIRLEYKDSFDEFNIKLKEWMTNNSCSEVLAGQIYSIAVLTIAGIEADAMTVIRINDYQANMIMRTLSEVKHKDKSPTNNYVEVVNNMQPRSMQINTLSERKSKSRYWVFACCLLGILCVLACIFAGCLYFENDSLNMQMAELRTKNDELAGIINQKDKEISSLNKTKELEKTSLDAKLVYDAMNNWKFYNYDSFDFFTIENIVVLREEQGDSFKIYNEHPEKNMYFSLSNNNIKGEWGDWIDDNTALMKITGVKKGTTTITFTNDYNNHTCKVLIVILPK